VPSNRTGAVAHGLQTLFQAGSLVGVSDGQLLERFALRDGEMSETAFAALVDRHGPMVWRTCRAVLRDEHGAADAFQATFLVLVRKAGSLWVRESIAPWLHRVAVRAANQARREVRRRNEAEQRAAQLNSGWTESEVPDDLADVIHQEIDRLPERHRRVVVLCELEERSCEEAARCLRCPVGTVKSRLARARERLRGALVRRGVMPTAVLAEMSRSARAAIDSPPSASTASTVRGSVLYAGDPLRAAGVISATALMLAEGVLKAMIRARLQSVVLVAMAAVGLLVPAWLAFAGQEAGERPKAPVPASPKAAGRSIDLQGNWIIRGSGEAIGLIRIEGPGRQPHATLLSIAWTNAYRLADSKVDHLRIDDRTVRFTLHLQAALSINSRTMEFIVYFSDDQPRPNALRGSLEYGRWGPYPANLERTDRSEIDRPQGRAPTPENDDLRRYQQTKDPSKRREILEEMLAKYKDAPMGQLAATWMVQDRAQAGAPEDEVRVLMDQAIRIAARYGREMEIGAMNQIIGVTVGTKDLDDLVLDYARRAVAKLLPSDSVHLQTTALKNLVSAVRKSTRIDDARATAEISALEDRIAALSRAAGSDPARGGEVAAVARRDSIPWARNFAAARKQAKAEGRLILVELLGDDTSWSRRFDADVFPRPEVVEAMRPFVSVKVVAYDGEGKPLAAQYHAHIPDYPTILFLDPTIDDSEDSRIVGKVPVFLPPSTFIEQLNAIARMPKDINQLIEKAHPDDGDRMRLLATAMAMQGRTKDAAALIERAWGPGSDPNFDRWAAVYNTLGDEVMLRMRSAEAAGWFEKAIRVAKRPVDVYTAHLGAGVVAMFQQKWDAAIRELEKAARVEGVSDFDRAFPKEFLTNMAKPPAGVPGIQEAAAALKRLESVGSRKSGDK
jgi:RNA polymerase sigma factor (sigma-70 family)